MGVRIGWIVAGLLALVACGSGSKPSGPSGPAPTDEYALNKDMEAHFSQVSRVQKAVIRGDLKGIRKPADWIANKGEFRDLPEGAAPHLAALRQAAVAALGAKEVQGAAAAVATMGVACGDCHVAVGVSVVKAADPPPVREPSTVAEHMQLHDWAAGRMWEALIGPGEEAWIQGVEMLESAKLHPAQFVARPGRIDVGVIELIEAVEKLTVRAKAAKQSSARGQVYGEFLGMCDGCHRAYKDSVSTPTRPDPAPAPAPAPAP